MKITLEVEDCRFSTVSGEYGKMRVLQTRLAGKHFFVSKQIYNDWRIERFELEHDSALIAMMEIMIESILLNAAVRIPNGVIETKCPGGELWRHHYAGRCGCKPEGV